MKIEDKIYIPHICPECSTARLILRDDLHDHPEIICSECGGVMRRWVVHKEAPQPYFSDESYDYLTYTPKLREITGSPWDRNSGFSLADVRKNVGDDLVDDPGMPEMIYLPSEVRAAELRAAHMADRLEDIIVTLVCNITIPGLNCKKGGTLRVESLPYSQLFGRIEELKHPVQTSTVKVWIAYSEETSQVFWLNDLEIDEPPRLPGYDVKYDKKRTAIRTPASGVI